MICQKLTQCVDYFSDPINGETNCCICCFRLKPSTVLKSIAIQDFLVSVGILLIGINSVVELKIFDYYLKTLSSDTLVYGIIFTASGGLIIFSMLIYYITNRKKNLKWFGLIYVLLRTFLFLAITLYAALLLIAVVNNNSQNEPIYGFEDTTKLEVSKSPGQYYGIIGVILGFSLLNNFFSFILYLQYRFISEGYEYERSINMQQKEVKQTFAPEWFRQQETTKKNVVNLQESTKQKGDSLIKSEGLLAISQTNRAIEVLPIKQSKFGKNKVVPENYQKEDDIKTKSTKAMIAEEADGRKTQNTMKVINVEDEEILTSLNNFNQF